MSDQLDQAAIRAWFRRTRERQGLPPEFSDATVRRLVALAIGTRPPNGNGDHNTKAPELTTPEPSTSTPTATKEVIGA